MVPACGAKGTRVWCEKYRVWGERYPRVVFSKRGNRFALLVPESKAVAEKNLRSNKNRKAAGRKPSGRAGGRGEPRQSARRRPMERSVAERKRTPMGARARLWGGTPRPPKSDAVIAT